MNLEAAEFDLRGRALLFQIFNLQREDYGMYQCFVRRGGGAVREGGGGVGGGGGEGGFRGREAQAGSELRLGGNFIY